MTAKKKPWETERIIAHFSGLRRYDGFACLNCNGHERFTYNNSCAHCKRVSDCQRIINLKEKGFSEKYDEPGTAKISEWDNRKFLSTLAKEKAHLL